LQDASPSRAGLGIQPAEVLLVKPIGKIIAVSVLSALCSGVMLAQDHHDDQQQYVRHDDWKKGQKIQNEDWNRGSQVDYKAHHLKAPARGYEWRQVDGNYVLAAAATGLIASAIVASGH
jgi:Ni/Co efflux regulator RcnB